jgi:hypothetical protein
MATLIIAGVAVALMNIVWMGRMPRAQLIALDVLLVILVFIAGQLQ